jgi:putative Holliday junction resolvase
MGIDFGSKRIGIAVSDANGVLASPRTVLLRTGSIAADHRRIAELVAEEEAVLVVVGLPLALDGTEAIAARGVLAEVAGLEKALDVPVEMYDERLTTASAHRTLAAQNVSSRKRRGEVDKWAAAVILQGYLDRHLVS